MENNLKTIDTLNELVEINNDRIAGYEFASKEAHEAPLKDLFTKLANTSRVCRQELATEIQKLGGKPREASTTPSSQVARIWQEVKTAVSRKDNKAILNSCETGDDSTVKVYETVLKRPELKTDHQTLVKKHVNLIRSEYDKVKTLRSTFPSL